MSTALENIPSDKAESFSIIKAHFELNIKQQDSLSLKTIKVSGYKPQQIVW